VVPPGGGTHGLLTKAAEIRGIDALCLDMEDDPGFVSELLRLVAEKAVGRMRAWHKLTQGADLALPNDAGFTFCDDSLQLLSPGSYERLVLPHHEWLYTAVTTGPRGIHLCGRAAQHYRVLRSRLNVTTIDGPGPFVDHASYLKEFGPEFAFVAQTDHSVLAGGTPGDIEGMMRGLLSPGARLPGRFQVLGYVTRDTPLANVQLAYEAGRRFGRIADDGGCETP
jgi:hypothetical protein